MSFADGGLKAIYDVVLSHLVSRAAENAMYVPSANSLSRPQAAPTCLIDPDGAVVCRAPRNKEVLTAGALTSGSADFRTDRPDHAFVTLGVSSAV